MHEQLLGYLMGALEDDEHLAVEEQLKSSHDLRRMLDQLRAEMEPLSWDHGHLEVPAGLASRTCDYVARRRIAVPLREYSGRGSRWSAQDFLVAASILVAASMLFIPAIGHSRGVARIAQCQNNLRQLAISLGHYSNAHGGYLPYIPPTGNLASSAAFAPRLVSAGLLNDHRILSCPDSPATGNKPRVIPAVHEVERAEPADLHIWDRKMGGDYRVTLGHVENDVYRPTRHRNRPYFAYASDAPHHGRQSANHGARGQNVLFDDWHVEFLKTPRCTPKDHADDIFCNASGKVAPGLTPDDAVIAEGRFELPHTVQVDAPDTR